MASSGNWRAAHPENKDTIANVTPFIEQAVPTRIKTTFYTMLGAVLGVMLIACVNVTNLQLARAAERAKEFAIRTALGSGRWRILRQSLAEGLVLSAIGAALGLGIAQFGVTYFMGAIADTQPPFWIDVRLDLTVLAFVTAITVAAALVSSVAPGLRVSRAETHLSPERRHARRDQPADGPLQPLARRRRSRRLVHSARGVGPDDSQHPDHEPARLRLRHPRCVFRAGVVRYAHACGQSGRASRARTARGRDQARARRPAHRLLDRRAGHRLLAAVPARRADVRKT